MCISTSNTNSQPKVSSNLSTHPLECVQCHYFQDLAIATAWFVVDIIDYIHITLIQWSVCGTPLYKNAKEMY